MNNVKAREIVSAAEIIEKRDAVDMCLRIIRDKIYCKVYDEHAIMELIDRVGETVQWYETIINQLKGE